MSSAFWLVAFGCAVVASGVTTSGRHAVADNTVSQSGVMGVDELFTKGMRKFRTGSRREGLELLEKAAEFGDFAATYNLARIYLELSASGGLGSVYLDRALTLFRALADRYDNVDPFEDRLAPYVALANYEAARLLLGLDERAGALRDEDAGRVYLERAALYFQHPDAQLERAKYYLSMRGNRQAEREAYRALLELVTQKGHPGAQAYSAELLWDGTRVDRNPVRALALATLAVSNAPAHDSIFIEQLYHRIYCATTPDERSAAVVEAQRIQAGVEGGRTSLEWSRGGIERVSVGRECGNGDRVPWPAADGGQQANSRFPANTLTTLEPGTTPPATVVLPSQLGVGSPIMSLGRTN